MERKMVYAAFSGFAVLSLFGVTLRMLAVTSLPGLNYLFLLHAHSHFAFAGWVFLSLALLILQAISPFKAGENKTIFIFTLISAFGMLVSFSFQGYRTISITFSTLFILVNYVFSYKVFRLGNAALKLNPGSWLMIRSSLIFLCISSIGPFSLGPLMALGLKSSPLYRDAIFFYLHFQMNGWMLMAALGFLMNTYLPEHTAQDKRLKTYAYMFIISTVPLYFLFTLWSSPWLIIKVIALVAALVNFISWIKILQYFLDKNRALPFLIKAALMAITLKTFFQLVTCFPLVGTWVFSNRNLIIGYIHLIVLGTIMPVILQQFVSLALVLDTPLFRRLNAVFLITVIVYLLLLFIQPALGLFNVFIPNYQMLLLGISIVLFIEGLAYLYVVKPLNRQTESFYMND